MTRQTLLVTAIIASGALARSGVLPNPPRVETMFHETWFGPAIAASTVILAVSLLLATSEAIYTYSFTAIRAARVFQAAAVLLAILTAATLSLIDPAPHWYWAVAPAALLVLTIPASGQIGRAAHLGRRGKRRSSHYYRTMKPRDESSQFEYEVWRDQVVRSIRAGTVRPKDLKGAAKLVWRRWEQATRHLRRPTSKRRQARAKRIEYTNGARRNRPAGSVPRTHQVRAASQPRSSSSRR